MDKIICWSILAFYIGWFISAISPRINSILVGNSELTVQEFGIFFSGDIKPGDTVHGEVSIDGSAFPIFQHHRISHSVTISAIAKSLTSMFKLKFMKGSVTIDEDERAIRIFVEGDKKVVFERWFAVGNNPPLISIYCPTMMKLNIKK